MTSILPAEFPNLVFEHLRGGEIRYEAIKDRVLSAAGSRISQSNLVPMDIGEARRRAATALRRWLNRKKKLTRWEKGANDATGAGD